VEEAALTQRAKQLGAELGVDALIFGAVTEYRYKRGLDEEPAVGITLRLMDVRSGQVLWVATVSRVGGCDIFCKDSLSRSAQAVCRDMASDLDASIRKEPAAASKAAATPLNAGPKAPRPGEGSPGD